MPTNNRRFSSLDSIRGVAAAVVLAYHLFMAFPQSASDYQPQSLLLAAFKLWPLRLLWAGHEAVLVFFVLSGFVLAMPFLGKAPGYRAFALRRLLRLYPPCLAALLLSAGLLTGLSTYQLEGASQHFNETWWFQPVSPSALLGNVLLDGASWHQYIDTPLWSLVHEIRISLVFPLLFLLAARLPAWAALLAAASFSLAASFLVSLVPGDLQHLVLFTALDTARFVVYFAIGIVIAIHREAIVARIEGWRASGMVVVALVGLVLMGSSNRLPYDLGDMLVGAGFALLLCLVLASRRACAALERPPLLWLGKISYSLYLVHLSVLLSLFYGLGSLLPLSAVILLVPPASIFAAWVFWWAVEQPSLAWSRRAERIVAKWDARRQPALLLESADLPALGLMPEPARSSLD